MKSVASRQNRVVLDNPPERLMQEWPRPTGECEFIREQHPWIGEFAR